MAKKQISDRDLLFKIYNYAIKFVIYSNFIVITKLKCC